MHLADGIVSDFPVAAAVSAVGAAGAVWAARRAANAPGPSAAWTGTLAAFVLAAQAINVPLVPGASAHVIGAGLLTLVLGPARAIVALVAVLLTQALLLADGGVTTLGINVLNIAVLPVLSVELCRRFFGERKLGRAAVVGTTLGNLAGAVALSVVLVLGAGAHPGATLGFLVGVQTLSGLVEGILTALAVRQLQARAPALLQHRTTQPESRRGLTWAAVAVGVAVLLVPLASSTPDALEVVLAHMR